MNKKQLDRDKSTGWNTDKQVGNYTHSFTFKINNTRIQTAVKKILSQCKLVIDIL
jgi:hypothetical protein